MQTDGKGRLLLIRHTESVWNKLNVFTGWVDVELSDAGKAHARQIGESIKGKYDVDKAYTSGLVRAQQTLQLVMEGADITEVPVVEDWHLNERFYGGWQGKNKTETAAKYGDEAVHSVRRGYSPRPPGGESLEDTTERVMEYFDAVIEPEVKNGSVVLIAAHGNSLRALAKKLENLTEEQVPTFEIANGELLAYRYEGDDNYARERDEQAL